MGPYHTHKCTNMHFLTLLQVLAKFATFLTIVNTKQGVALAVGPEGEASMKDPKYRQKLHVDPDASQMITECYMRHLRQHLSRNARAVPSPSRALSTCASLFGEACNLELGGGLFILLLCPQPRHILTGFAHPPPPPE